MATEFRFEGSADLLALQRDLERAASFSPKQARAVVKKGAQNIKSGAQKRVAGLKHAPAYPQAITYDTHDTPTGGWAEIGPDKNKRQGALGNLIEFGSVHNAPRPHLGPEAELEEPRTARYLEQLAVESLERPGR
jgi:hypothetical protein